MKLIVAYVVLVWAVGAMLVGAFDPLGEFATGEQVFNGIFMGVVVGGVGNWIQRLKAERPVPTVHQGLTNLHDKS